MLICGSENELWTPSTWPISLADLDALITRLTAGQRSLKTWLAAGDTSDALASNLVVLVQGKVLYGYQIFGALLPKVTRPSIEPIILTRVDAAWALGRDHNAAALNARRAKHVLFLGCGALGSPVVELLARAGLGHIDLIDHEVFDVENCARHVLGMTDVGRSKSVALAERINRELPGAVVTGVPATASAWILDRCEPGDYDLVVDCTGESAVRLLLSHEGSRVFGTAPILHAWIEPYCAAAHVVATFPPDNWPDSDPADQYVNAADWPPDTRVDLPACASGFHPYGAADAWQAAGMLAAKVIQIIDGSVINSTIWSWVRGRHYFDSLPGAIEPRRMVPSLDSGLDSVVLTRVYSDVIAGLG